MGANNIGFELTILLASHVAARLTFVKNIDGFASALSTVFAMDSVGIALIVLR
jgi:hypothetical protein